ncbi:MAG: DUF3363 domain-containing protein [Hyphomonas sp.]|uniref:DUF3363 domain-containing protein n=1 Tax=Hyphomonas sp. TaxID=87 RepID=UPI003002DC6C
MAKAFSIYGGPRRSQVGLRRRSGDRNGRRRVIVKTRTVRMAASSRSALMNHIGYIRRDSALSNEDRGQLFDRDSDTADSRPFVEGASTDRHHFRFIISPEEGAELADLKPFVRDLVSQMEKDLATRLEWIGAEHHDTGRPHVHLIVRGRHQDGQDLKIPQEYLYHAVREHAEDLITLELGPETALEVDRKRQAEPASERLTRIDSILERQSDPDGLFELKNSPVDLRAQHAARLRTLERLGLADKRGSGRWLLDPDFKTVLTSLGERQDKFDILNHAIARTGGRRIDADGVFDSADPDSRSVTGAVLETGKYGIMQDRPYIVIDGLDGRAVFVETGSTEPANLRQDMIISLAPANRAPEATDRAIDRIARKNGGLYSAAFHQKDDPRVTAETLRRHVMRLQAMVRPANLHRSSDAVWTIPEDYLQKVQTCEPGDARMRKPFIRIESALSLSAQIKALGLTWIDTFVPPADMLHGFGSQTADAQLMRRTFLAEIGIAPDNGKPLTPEHKAELIRRDLAQAGQTLRQTIGKPYAPSPTRGEVAGIYRGPVARISGKFAVIERAFDFTILPWRDGLEHSRAMAVSVRLQSGSASWTTAQRGLTI